MIRLEAVAKVYGGKAAVDGVSLEIAAGERLALLGHNGAGKTTLMKMILGLTRPTSGRIEVLGGAPGREEARRSIGYLPENVAFHPLLSGRETLRALARLKGVGHAEVEPALKRVGLSEAADRLVRTYSKGMRQRLGLAQALLGAPRVLLLDEPTSGLDPMLRQAFYEIIAELSAAGTAVLLSSHLLTELETRTDRAAIMREGRLLVVDSLESLRRRAGLPVRIRLRSNAAAEIAARMGATRVNGRAVELLCSSEDKIETLRRLTSLPVDIEDLELTAPSLDEIYAKLGSGAVSA